MSLRCRHVHEGLLATPFAFAFGLFDRFAPASARCVGSNATPVVCRSRALARGRVRGARTRARHEGSRVGLGKQENLEGEEKGGMLQTFRIRIVEIGPRVGSSHDNQFKG